MDMVDADYRLLLDTFLPAIELQAGAASPLFAAVGDDGSVHEITIHLRDGDSGLVRGQELMKRSSHESSEKARIGLPRYSRR